MGRGYWDLHAPFLEPGGDEALNDLPMQFQAGIRNYVMSGIMPGGFLCALIDNDFHEMLARADAEVTLAQVKLIHSWFHTYVPEAAYGSKHKRERWARVQFKRAGDRVAAALGGDTAVRVKVKLGTRLSDGEVVVGGNKIHMKGKLQF